jgi:hypothetical protein
MTDLEDLRQEIVELKETVKDLAAAVAALTKKDEDAQVFTARIEEIASWEV